MARVKISILPVPLLKAHCEKIREQVLSVPHSLFPVCRGSLDKVISIARAKELLDVIDDEEQLKDLIKRHRPIYIFEKMILQSVDAR